MQTIPTCKGQAVAMSGANESVTRQAGELTLSVNNIVMTGTCHSTVLRGLGSWTSLHCESMLMFNHTFKNFSVLLDIVTRVNTFALSKVHGRHLCFTNSKADHLTGLTVPVYAY
jgi:hypothetical protein